MGNAGNGGIDSILLLRVMVDLCVQTMQPLGCIGHSEKKHP